MNEMFKYGSTIILVLAICNIFNFILNSGSFPEEWNITYQVLLYRGIAIGSCLLEFFTSISQMRLLNFIEDTNQISHNQAAFRPGKSTVDHLFVIKIIVNKYVKSLRKSLYCCFVEFSKALYSV